LGLLPLLNAEARALIARNADNSNKGNKRISAEIIRNANNSKKVNRAWGLLPVLNAGARALIVTLCNNSNKGIWGISKRAADWGLVKAGLKKANRAWGLPPLLNAGARALIVGRANNSNKGIKGIPERAPHPMGVSTELRIDKAKVGRALRLYPSSTRLPEAYLVGDSDKPNKGICGISEWAAAPKGRLGRVEDGQSQSKPRLRLNPSSTRLPGPTLSDTRTS